MDVCVRSTKVDSRLRYTCAHTRTHSHTHTRRDGRAGSRKVCDWERGVRDYTESRNQRRNQQSMRTCNYFGTTTPKHAVLSIWTKEKRGNNRNKKKTRAVHGICNDSNINHYITYSYFELCVCIMTLAITLSLHVCQLYPRPCCRPNRCRQKRYIIRSYHMRTNCDQQAAQNLWTWCILIGCSVNWSQKA